LDTIKGPFSYEALAPKDIKFAPLNKTVSMNGAELFEHIDANDLHLKKFLPIIRDSPVYPVIYDSNRVVLSLPPIINGDHSKITLNTKNVFIEVTGTDLTKAEIALNMIIAAFSEYASDKYSVEPVEIILPNGETKITPNIETRIQSASLDYINKCLGIEFVPENLSSLLKRMSLPGKLSGDKTKIEIAVPITRSGMFSFLLFSSLLSSSCKLSLAFHTPLSLPLFSFPSFWSSQSSLLLYVRYPT
jgi:phenylalanyl-tRNA synthetase beta chain